MYSLKVNKINRMYCCEASNDRLHCIDMSGTSIFSYLFSYYERPVDISFDSKDNLYVVTWKSNKLHRLTPDGKLIDIIMTKAGGLSEPFTSVFSNDYSKLYVLNSPISMGKSVLIFNCF